MEEVVEGKGRFLGTFNEECNYIKIWEKEGV